MSVEDSARERERERWILCEFSHRHFSHSIIYLAVLFGSRCDLQYQETSYLSHSIHDRTSREFSLTSAAVQNLTRVSLQLILNNFAAEDKPSKLMATMLQSMFPSLNIQTVSFKSDFNFNFNLSLCRR